MQAPSVWTAVQHCYESDALLEKAQARYADAAKSMFLPHKVEISASAAGKCALEQWAYLHGLYDLPERYETMLAKMDGGTMYGARIATLFAAAYEDLNPGCTVELEAVSDNDGIPGHIDITIKRGDASLWVVELKTAFWGGEFSGPAAYQIIQAANYALGQGAPGFSVFTLLPAARHRKGQPPTFHAQADFATEEWAVAVRQEYARLRQAEGDSPPPADPKEAWRCASCRFSACPKNTNPLKEALCPL